MLSLFGKVAIPILIIVVFALARRYLPSPASPIRPPLEELELRFKATQWIFGIGMVGVGVLIFFALHQTLITINRYLASLDGPADFVLYPQSAIWYFLPGFAAITMSWDVTLWAWSSLGQKQTVLLYEYWSNAKAGFNATRLLRLVIVVVVLPIAILSGLALPEHDSLRANEIRSHGYGVSPAKVFRYSEAKDLFAIEGFRTRDGKLMKRAGCILYFSDGRRWSSADIGDFKPTIDPRLLAFLQNKTGLPVKYATTERDDYAKVYGRDSRS